MTAPASWFEVSTDGQSVPLVLLIEVKQAVCVLVQVFEIDEWKSWRAVAITIPAVALGYAALAVAPWYMLPAVYAYMSAAMTGLFVIGHDAGTRFTGHCLLVSLGPVLLFSDVSTELAPFAQIMFVVFFH
jgi:hypothetical protein